MLSRRFRASSRPLVRFSQSINKEQEIELQSQREVIERKQSRIDALEGFLDGQEPPRVVEEQERIEVSPPDSAEAVHDAAPTAVSAHEPPAASGQRPSPIRVASLCSLPGVSGTRSPSAQSPRTPGGSELGTAERSAESSLLELASCPSPRPGSMSKVHAMWV